MNHPNYPMTRHLQRYEYLTDMGYVNEKRVLDIGCGYGYGSAMLSFFASDVVGLDPVMLPFCNKSVMLPTFVIPGRKRCSLRIRPIQWEDMGDTKEPIDVIVAIEFIEHVQEPDKFLEFASKNCKNLFLTTPLAKVTGPTENPAHVTEYSHEDFVGMVSKYFDIEKELYQTGDLRLVDEAGSNGSSFSTSHIVQMLWCASKQAKGEQQ